jgi:cholesterol transport system auxiliary component
MRASLLLHMAAAAPVLLTACAAPSGSVTQFDLGPQYADASFDPRLANTRTVTEVSAPAWLDNPAIVYRLAYADASRAQAYAQSQWVAPPASLLSQRLRERLFLVLHSGVAQVGGIQPASACLLQVELDEFSQVFDTPQTSHALLRARATLTDSNRNELVAQRVFEVEQPAPSPDASGGAHGLRDAVDQFITELLQWMDQQQPGRVVLVGDKRSARDLARP